MQSLTAEWVDKAEKDYRLAVRLARSREPFHDQLCFLLFPFLFHFAGIRPSGILLMEAAILESWRMNDDPDHQGHLRKRCSQAQRTPDSGRGHGSRADCPPRGP